MSAFDTLTRIPSCIVAGSAETWTETLPEYPSGTFTLVYYFAGQTPCDGFQKFSVTGSGSGTTWTFTFPTISNVPKPGAYRWQQIVTRASDSSKREIAGGVLVVSPNMADTPTTSAAQEMLENLEAAIKSLSGGTNQSVSFNGQSFTKKDMNRLLDMRTNLQAEVIRKQEQLAALSGRPVNRSINVRFI